MKFTAFLVIALIISLLSFSASNDLISNGDEFIHFKQVTMRFQGTDAVISMSYGLDMFSSMYISLMGAHNLEPAIDNFFWDFGDVEILELGRGNAVIFAKNVSRKNDAFYLYDSHTLNGTVDVLTMVLPDGSTQGFMNANSTEPTFYDV
ncbi:hypothetical protein RE474_01835 [Methanolobus sediminis]|uniref:Uncharacterized protein n=1 Tax=Methanolobus sediminis TaxID=3072978 RepID=A0AA51YMD4_9EURY|nr:hypothetical protein [Methanolobus sediminis]WMW25483.1 hypothetical protein RE474_01835 [Methanolobus sediminis]